MKKTIKTLILFIGVFAGCYFLPVDNVRFSHAVTESLALVKWYAREHVLLCLVPAFFIAGGIAVFIRQGAVMKYLGAGANKVIAYSVAAVSGSILAICSCTVLPLFAGIYRMGAGLGPATAFLYSGPAINVLAIILTARILGLELGIARAVGAIVFSVVIGVAMELIFRREKQTAQSAAVIPAGASDRPLWQTVLFFGAMVAVLVFSNWGKPGQDSGLWHSIYMTKWWIAGGGAAVLGLVLGLWFGVKWWKIAAGAALVVLAVVWAGDRPVIAFSVGIGALVAITASGTDENRQWLGGSWDLAKQILPLLFGGVLVAGLLLGRPGGEGLIRSEWVSKAVGGNSWQSNLFASAAGALMYFATLTEVPILQGLIASGMGKGPALALLLAGPALSLPNMLVIRSVMGMKKTIVYVLLVVVMATISGMFYGVFI